MYDQVELAQRLVIIKDSGLDDATIINQNYRYLIRYSNLPEEKQQYKVLHETSEKRIVELKGKDETII